MPFRQLSNIHSDAPRLIPKALIFACGPAAEAKIQGVPFATVWRSPSAYGDTSGFARDCYLAGLGAREAGEWLRIAGRGPMCCGRGR